MGLDLLDLSFRIKQRFDVDLPPDGQSWAEFGWSSADPDGRPFEFTVGQIYEYLLARVEIVEQPEKQTDVATADATWSPREVWDELSQILVECLAVDPEDVTPEARLIADLGAA